MEEEIDPDGEGAPMKSIQINTKIKCDDCGHESFID